MLTILALTHLLAGSALAAEGNGRSSLVLPGAGSTASLELELSVGTGVAVPTGDVAEPAFELGDPEWSSSADLLWAPGDRVAVETQALFGVNHLLSMTSVRAVVARNEHWGFAPWLGTLVLGPVPETGWDLVPMAGAAVDYRAPRWGFDATWAAVMVRIDLDQEDEAVVMPGLPEVGLSWHPGETTMLRAGVAAYLPTLRWRHEFEGFFYELDAIGVVGGSYQARGGVRF